MSLPLQLTFENRTVETALRDLSTSGIRFSAPVELPLLSRVQIALELPETAKGGATSSLAIAGVVVRSDSDGEDAPEFDTAIYFEDLSAGTRARIAQFVAARAED